ncbi:dCTP deaminase [Methylotenera versatilis]|uniref:Deoxycytidine triphosphate deaminase n=1 Tax=Methylotenera versatilis (strain 301) TaxID=666681 RepID=D7DJQ2_METV0|nr:dCTP deaminase [Methylotenera versatilis]ADI28412.1 deoxycytidine triphosphate deaminase [Methylotenera versatilis 301]
MSVLGNLELHKLLSREKIEERLIVTPLFNQDKQINEASIDIRLGNDFIVTRRGNLASLDPARQDVRESRYQTKHFVNFKEPFYLHPQELVLAGTLEYFRLPIDVAATVTSRSQWGRAGLVIATATAVHPGFCGTITLELLNLGEVPLVLYPGTCVAQIVFYECVGGTAYKGQMSHKTDAHFAGVSADMKMNDKEFWLPEQS